MKPSNETMVAFYRQLGKLFYAVADADKHVVPQEVNAMKDLVKAEWLAVDHATDRFGSDAAFQIEIVFDWLLDNGFHLDRVLPEFERFHAEHHSLFNPQVNALILKTAHAIASSFGGENKSELVFLQKLELILAK